MATRKLKNEISKHSFESLNSAIELVNYRFDTLMDLILHRETYSIPYQEIPGRTVGIRKIMPQIDYSIILTRREIKITGRFFSTPRYITKPPSVTTAKIYVQISRAGGPWTPHPDSGKQTNVDSNGQISFAFSYDGMGNTLSFTIKIQVVDITSGSSSNEIRIPFNGEILGGYYYGIGNG